jgi:hypothetical protein
MVTMALMASVWMPPEAFSLSCSGSRVRVELVVLRQLVLRAIRPYTAHEDKFDDAVATTIGELTRATDHDAAALEALERRLHEEH